jgi:hypothetical protein
MIIKAFAILMKFIDPFKLDSEILNTKTQRALRNTERREWKSGRME